MKRLVTLCAMAAVGSMLIASSAIAGIDYIKYNEEFMKNKSAPSAPSESKHFQHKSKELREQKEGTVVPTKERAPNRQINKYERSYWDPTQ